MEERALAWDACLNVRDLGGLPLRGGGFTRSRALIRSDSPHRLTPAGRAALLAYGVRTVLDLRGPTELEREPNPFASADGEVRYLNVALQSEAASAAIHGVDDRAAVNQRLLDLSRPNVAAVVGAIARAPEGGVLFHCAVGKDRSGLVAALLLKLAGATEEAIADDYAESETCLRPLCAEVLARAEPSEHDRLRRQWAAPRGAVLATLGHLERRYGGVAAYLRGSGVGDADLRLTRDRLV